MKNTIDFDVNQIQKIYFRPSYHEQRYEWKIGTAKPIIKKFLWLKKIIGYNTTPTGFYDTSWSHFASTFIEEERLIKCNYIIKELGTKNGISHTKEAWVKPYVEVVLGHKSSVSKTFDTDQEAKDWIEKLKEMSNKTFETI